MLKVLKSNRIYIFIGIVLFLLCIFLFSNNIDSSHTSKTVTIISSLTALISVVGTLYNKMLEEENKAKLFELEKKHQISKEVYQQLFEKKMQLYEKLYNIFIKYRKELQGKGREIFDIDERGEMDYYEITEQKIFFDIFLDIKNEIENNIFLISNKLEEIFLPMLETYEENEKDIHQQIDLGIIDYNETKKEYERLINKFYEKHKDDLNKFWKELKKEIREIREKIKD